jgi:endogenous inhibitor of DNA gyrase (YacG/DUF329 family)
MLTVSCPGCGAPVEFKSHASALAVCPFCRTSVVRDDAATRHAGRLSAVLEDYSPIQLGTAGIVDRRGFTVIGRIQLRYEHGLWNEWFVLFDDGATGWLGDASGTYMMTTARGIDELAPSFDALRPGAECDTLDGRYVVADKRTARCIGGEGELPIVVGDGWEARVVDLRRGSAFVTLDYSDGARPVLYAGAMRTLEQMRCQLLRDDEAIKASAGRYRGRAESLACPQCGAALSYLPGVTSNLVCQSCRSQLDASTPVVDVLQAGDKASRQQLKLQLGSKGRMNGHTYRVLGAMVRADEENERWTEYLLYSEKAGFKWLIDADGEWWRADVMDAWPEQATERLVRIKQVGYKRVADYEARVVWVAGAFNWRVAVGDVVRVTEYEEGRTRLAAELTGEEVTWSRSSRVTADQVELSFGLRPKKKTVAERTSMRTQSWRFLLWLVGLNVIPLIVHFGGVAPWVFLGMLALVLPPYFVKDE